MLLMPSNNFRHLDADHLIRTAAGIRNQISGRFPDAGLKQVADTIVDVTEQAINRAEAIRRPDWRLRTVMLVLAVVVLALVGVIVWETRLLESPLDQLRDLARALGGATVYLGAAVVFFWTLETRLKRARAIKALHELRALAHIIDMHQISKGPEKLGCPLREGSTDGPMSAPDLGRYLHFCTELLAIVSKIGQLYVQDFPDGTTLEAVDQCENLATGLSQKIWQKIMILDRVRSPDPDLPATDGEPVPAPSARPASAPVPVAGAV
jgi:hypothetical protein